MEISIYEHLLFYVMMLVEIFSYVYFIFSITKNSITLKKYLFSVVTFFTISVIADIIVIFSNIIIIKTIFSILSVFIIIKFILKENIAKSIIEVILTFFISVIVEVLVFSIVKWIFPITTDSSLSHNWINILVIWGFSVLLFIVGCFINKNNTKILVTNLANIGNNFNYKVLLVLILFVPQFLLIFLLKYDFSFVFLILSIVQVITIVCVLNKYSYAIADKLRIEQELKNVELYNQMLIIHNEGVRGFKHDFNNIIQAIGGFVSLDNLEGLKAYYAKGLLKECSVINTVSSLTPKIINEPAMYSIIVNKYIEATKRNIDFKIEFMCNASKINMSKYELSRILGILLDNAIEASAVAEPKEILLRVVSDYQNKEDVITIENTFVKTDEFKIENVFKKDYSTKKVESGFGLYEVQKLVDRASQANIVTGSRHNKFIQTLIIENDALVFEEEQTVSEEVSEQPDTNTNEVSTEETKTNTNIPS